MAARNPPAMDMQAFEVLQKATIAHAQNNGINQPSLFSPLGDDFEAMGNVNDFAVLPPNITEMQRPFRNAVCNGQTSIATFYPPQVFADNGWKLQADFLRNIINNFRNRR